MKTTLSVFLSILFFTILSCKKSNTENMQAESTSKPFFNYDEIEYYHSDINDISETYDKLSSKKIDSLEFKVLVGVIPKDIADSSFVSKLNKIGFYEISLSKLKQDKLREIFVDKNRKSEPKDAMKPIFTDILIFKKNKNIVGFSTLSIKNLQSRIIGSESNSDYFPSNSEHQQLEKILLK